MADTEKVVATAGLVSVAVGSANSIVKYKRPPSTRFLIGSGVAFMALSAMAASDTFGELAKGLALGVMSTILLGEGGGVMTYFAGKEEVDTRKPKKDAPPPNTSSSRQGAHTVAHPMVVVGGHYRSDRLTPQPFNP